MTYHTPDPWWPNVSCVGTAVCAGPDHDPKVIFDSVRTDEQTRANALVIAAAPAMLQAIDDFLLALDRGYLPSRLTNDGAESAFVIALREVSRRARGGRQ